MLIFDAHKSIVIKDQSDLLIKEKLELEKNKMFYLNLMNQTVAIALKESYTSRNSY